MPADQHPHNFRLTTDGSAGNYYVAYSLGRRTPRRSMGTTDKEVARQRMKIFVATLLAPKVDGKPDELLVTHLLHLYDEDKGSQLLAGHTHRHAMRLLLEFYADRYVSDIPTTNDEFETWMRDERELGPATINRVRSTLRAALKTAHRKLKLTVVPFIPTVAPPPADEDYLTMKQLLKLLGEMRGDWRYHLRLFTLIAYFTAARHEAVMSLTWDKVDFDKGTIDFRRRNKKGKLEVETNKRRPYAPMADKLIKVLRYAHTREVRVAKQEGRKPLAHVVHYQGRALTHGIEGAFKSACIRAGIGVYTPHILKHTRITLMLEAGVSPWDVSGATATSLRTIEKVYGKHVKKKLKLAVNAV